MKITFRCSEDVDPAYADEIIRQLHLSPRDLSGDTESTHILTLDRQGLGLQRSQPRAGEENSRATRVDFMDAALHYRLHTFGKNQGIAKAVGLNRHEPMHVLDATAGFGKDAFLLASLGCRLTMLEASPLVYCLLADAFRRVATLGSDEVQTICRRMQLQHARAEDCFERIKHSAEEKPDVIYLDPMFPPRHKSASVKKDMTLLQEVLEQETEPDELIDQALQCDVKRVVLKRPGSGPAKNDRRADFIVPGKTAHFAVFV